MIKGAQSLERALDILQRVARSNGQGTRLADLLDQTGLSRPTLHRLLSAMTAHGVIDHDARNRRYYLGERLHLWTMSAMPAFDFRESYGPVLIDLAARTGDTAFIKRRIDDEAVCLARESGSFPVKALVIDVGMRRVLGLGAGGLAILAAMPRSEAEAILARNAAAIAAAGADPAGIQRSLAEARESGHAASTMAGLGVRTVAMAIPDSSGRPMASVSVAGIIERMTGAHLALVLDALAAAVVRLRRDLARRRPPNPA